MEINLANKEFLIEIKSYDIDEISNLDDLSFRLKYKRVFPEGNYTERKLDSKEIEKVYRYFIHLYNKERKTDIRKDLNNNDFLLNKTMINFIKDKLSNNDDHIYQITNKNTIFKISNRAKLIERDAKIENGKKIAGGSALAVGAALYFAIKALTPSADDVKEPIVPVERAVDNQDNTTNETQVDNSINTTEETTTPVVDTTEIETETSYTETLPFDPDTTYIYSYDSNNNQNDKDTFNRLYNNYGVYFEEAGSKYGIDPSLLCAIACVENPDERKNNDKNSGYGLMQIEYSQWNNKDLPVMNFETNQKETIHIDCEECQNNPEYCINVAAAIFREDIRWVTQSNTNISNRYNQEECMLLALEAYNKGAIVTKNMGNFETFDECINNIREYSKTHANSGDCNYVQKIFNKLDDGALIKMLDMAGNEVSYAIDNTYNPTFQSHKKAM